MGWMIGGWRILREGEVHQVFKKCINILVEEKFTLRARLGSTSKELEYGRELYEVLREFERQHGVNDLLEVLTAGLRVECSKDSERITMEILLRTPSESEDQRRLFKDIFSGMLITSEEVDQARG